MPVSSPSTTQPPTLTLESVDVWLSGRHVLRDVSFSLGPGSVTGLIGPNGAGKTTLFKVILGLLHPQHGRVSVPGADGSAHRSHGPVGYVPQKLVFDPDMPLRARDVVALGLDGDRWGVPLSWRRRRGPVEEMLEAVGAAHLGDARVGDLSGGEQQRVLVAHALVGRPSLLLLDEPLANLDIRAEQEVVELLARIAEDQNVTVFISAHDMNPLLQVMDHIVYIADGRTVNGTTDEVVRSDVLSGLYGHHVDVLGVHGRILVVAGRDDQAQLGEGHGHDHLDIPDEPGVVSVL